MSCACLPARKRMPFHESMKPPQSLSLSKFFIKENRAEVKTKESHRQKFRSAYTVYKCKIFFDKYSMLSQQDSVLLNCHFLPKTYFDLYLYQFHFSFSSLHEVLPKFFPFLACFHPCYSRLIVVAHLFLLPEFDEVERLKQGKKRCLKKPDFRKYGKGQITVFP